MPETRYVVEGSSVQLPTNLPPGMTVKVVRRRIQRDISPRLRVAENALPGEVLLYVDEQTATVVALTKYQVHDLIVVLQEIMAGVSAEPQLTPLDEGSLDLVSNHSD